MGQEDLTWVSRSGIASKPIEISGLHTTGTGTFALSPDGKRVAASRQLEAGSDIWVKQLPDGPLDRLTFEGSPNYYPSWSPDGKFVTFVSGRTRERSLFVRASNGTGRDSTVFSTAGGISSGRLSPDGQWLAITSDMSRHVVAVRRSDGTQHVVSAPDGAYVVLPQCHPTDVGLRTYPTRPDALRCTCGHYLIRRPGSGSYPRTEECCLAGRRRDTSFSSTRRCTG